MTTKTRNIVIVVALLLVILSLILSTPLSAVDGGKAFPSGSLPAPSGNPDAVWAFSTECC